MARPLRVEYPGAWYHVMNRGRRKERIFFEEEDYALFLKTVKEAYRLFNIEIHAYVLMPNHYHLLVHTPLGNLSRGMRHVNGVYTQKINNRNKIDGSLFRGRYKSIVIDAEEYLLEVVRYIHRNPLKAGLEKSIGSYEWCSHKYYMREKVRPELLQVKEVLDMLNADEKEAKKALEAFVQKEVPKELNKKLESVKWPSVLGGKKFREKIKKMLKGKDIDAREVPQYKKEIDLEYKRLSDEAVKKLIGMKKDVLGEKSSRRSLSKRRAIFFMIKQSTSKSNKEICNMLQGITRLTDSALAKQYRIAVEEVDDRRGCYRYVVQLKDEVKSLFET